MALRHLELVDFRSFSEVVVEPDPAGTTVFSGPNGTGKTTILEAVAYLGLQRSFRGAPKEAMVKTGCERAVVRGELDRAGLPLLVEAELVVTGRSRSQVNRQPARSRRDLAEAVPVTVFSPDDLGIVQGSPGRRRDVLDDALGLLDPAAAAAGEEVARVLRQRGALLRQSGGRLGPDVASTLDVWDDRLGAAGTQLAEARENLVETLVPVLAGSYRALAGSGEAGTVRAAYSRSWEANLVDALAAGRREDLRRGTTGVGPHRDDLVLTIAGRDARLQASQGEQRCLALALRLGVHRLVAERTGAFPLLLLDDVFSELDPLRSRALIHELPEGQALLTTAVPLPEGVSVAATLDVRRLAGDER